MTIQIVRPDHRAASAVRSIHYSFVRNVNLLAIDAHAILTKLAFPIDVLNSLCVTIIAARSLATVQALIPIFQLRTVMIVSTSRMACKHR